MNKDPNEQKREQKPEQQRREAARWPFDPMQPGDHEPARLPEELQRIQKQTGAGDKRSSGKEEQP